MAKSKPHTNSQFHLLGQRRFAPFFFTQFAGAFNDNVFRNALILLIAFEAATFTSIDSDILNNLAQALFILPFFLFSAFAGQLADKHEKSRYIRWIKTSEILIMGCAAVAFFYQSIWGLLAVLFFMGAQSAFFGPVKYSIIPQHLSEEDLVGGNALVEMGTFLAILLGTAVAGLLMQLEAAVKWVALSVVLIAIVGRIASQGIPTAQAQAPQLKVTLNPIASMAETLSYARLDHSVFLAILGISWFWFLGASYLTQLPNFTIEALSADKSVVTLLLCVFSIGIGLGSLLCDRLSGHKIEIGIVPLGSIGLSIFGIDLCIASSFTQSDILRDLSVFMAQPGAYRVVFDMAMIGVFGGLFIVPLYAMVQQRTPAGQRARVIAANNILNAMFMVASAIAGILFLGYLELSKPHYFLLLAVVNAAVALFIYRQVPEFTLRFVVWLLGHSLYKVSHHGLDNIPEKGPALLVCNHVSYVDALLIGGAVRRPVRFVMYKPIYDMPLLNFLFRTAKTIPVTTKEQDITAYNKAFELVSHALESGELVCIFPEGQLTRDGRVGPFKSGIEKIIAKNPVPVIPLALRGLWGSLFSHAQGGERFALWRRFRVPVELLAGAAVLPQEASARMLRDTVLDLRDKNFNERTGR